MKSLKTQEIDGIQIITGFQKRPIDPMATKSGPAGALMQGLPELAELQNKANQGIECARKAGVEKKKAIEFRKIKDNKQADIHSQKSKDHFGEANIRNDEMKEIKSRLVPKQKEILKANTVYFEPRLGEVIKTELEIADLELKFLDRGQNRQLKSDGLFIDDFRGVAYNKKTSGKWSKVVIDKIGVKMPTGGKLDADLTDTDKTEIEAGRVVLLSVEEKTAEKTTALDFALTASVKMRAELEIKADSGALTKSQDFYNGEVAKIESKYI